MRQHSLFPATPLFHGGELSLGKRKTVRPLARKRPLHLVLKSRQPLRAHSRQITQEAQRLAQKFGLRAYSLAIASDHLHLVVKIPGRRQYQGFIRSFTGLLARRLGRGLWSLLHFSRVASWGKDFAQLRSYLQKNRAEASGARPYEPRRDWYGRGKKQKTPD